MWVERTSRRTSDASVSSGSLPRRRARGSSRNETTRKGSSALVLLALLVIAATSFMSGCTASSDRRLPGNQLGGQIDNDFARGFIGTWDVVWDRGKAWEERATVVVSERNGRLTASGMINLSVTAEGRVTFTDIEGYDHVGQVSSDKTFASGIYTGSDWTGSWEASKR